MNKRSYLRSIATTLVVLTTIAGCSETSRVEATGKGTIRGINSIATAPTLDFKIEEVTIGNANFKQAAGFAPFDDLSYNFNFDIIIPGATDATRLATQFINVIADTEYTIAIGGTVAAPTILSWEEPAREFADGASVFEADFVHLSPTLGEVDVYFTLSGSVPVQGEALGTLNYGERIPYQEFADTNRELFITLKDDPDNYLYRSITVGSTPATRVTYAIFDTDPSITADIAVNQIDSTGVSNNLPDSRIRPMFRLLHAANGTDRVDAYLNNDFGTIVFADAGFGEITTYSEIDSVSTPFTLTDVGNSGAPVHDDNIAVGGNSRHTIFLTGEPGTLGYLGFRDDGRPLETSPQVRFANLSVSRGSVNIYMQPPGTVIDSTVPLQFNALPSLQSSGYLMPVAGSYEITLTDLAEFDPIATPITIDITNGDIVNIAILDTVDPAVVDLLIFDSTLP